MRKSWSPLVSGLLLCLICLQGMVPAYGLANNDVPVAENPAVSESSQDEEEQLEMPIANMKWNVYYAIQSYGQYQDLFQPHIPDNVDYVSFGWARVVADKEGKAQVETQLDGTSSFYYPQGGADRVKEVQSAGKKAMLNVYGDRDWDLLLDQGKEIGNLLLAHGEFDGVVLDFETVTAKDRIPYLVAVYHITKILQDQGKEVWVAAQPRAAYDLSVLTTYVDGVVLMLHDYEPKSMKGGGSPLMAMTPQTPIGALEEDLKEMTQGLSQDQLDKVRLQFSMATTQWKLVDGAMEKTPEETIRPYRPLYSRLIERLKGEKKPIVSYHEPSQNPYMVFHDPTDDTWNVLWYENERSIEAKIKLANRYGINQFSLWRLGNVPRASHDELNLPQVFQWD